MSDPANSNIFVPYHIWVFAQCNTSSDNRGHATAISTQNFDQVMASYHIEIMLEIENLIPQSDSVSFVSLPIKSIEDFHPYSIASNVEVLKPLFASHQTLKKRLEEKITEAQCNEILIHHQTHPLIGNTLNNVINAVNETTVVTQKTANNDDKEIDRLFGMLDLGEQSVEAPSSLGKSADTFSQSYRALLNTSMHEIQRTLFQQLDKIIHNNQFQALEQTWRGLKFLVDALPDNESIVLTLLNTDKNNLASDYTNAISNIDETLLPSLTIFDVEINCTANDLTALDDIAISSEAYQVPTIINLSNNFMGKTRAQSLIGSANDLSRLFSQPQYVKWKSLRSKSHGRWITTCFNRFLLRAPYNRHNNSDLEFNEWIAGDDVLLMGHPSWMLARLAVESINEFQWPSELTPPHGVIKNLPIHSFDLSTERRFSIPLETIIDDTSADEVAELGIAALLCQPDKDSVFFRNLPTLFKPALYDNAVLNYKQKLLASLPYQLVSTRFVNIILLHLNEILSAPNTGVMSSKVEKLIHSLIAETGGESSVAVQVVADSHNPGHHLAKIKIKMGNLIMNGVEVELGIPL